MKQVYLAGPITGQSFKGCTDWRNYAKVELESVGLIGADRVSIGTVAEMAWAYMKQKPIVIAMEPSGNPHEHIFVGPHGFAKFRVDSLEGAIDVVKCILN
jgi:hypothetical protein